MSRTKPLSIARPEPVRSKNQNYYSTKCPHCHWSIKWSILSSIDRNGIVTSKKSEKKWLQWWQNCRNRLRRLFLLRLRHFCGALEDHLGRGNGPNKGREWGAEFHSAKVAFKGTVVENYPNEWVRVVGFYGNVPSSIIKWTIQVSTSIQYTILVQKMLPKFL